MRGLVVCPVLVVVLTAMAPAGPPLAVNPGGRMAISVADLPEGARPSDYLRFAQDALAAGRPLDAQEALEMAQTRLLDRSVPLGRTRNPIVDVSVEQIGQARRALAAHDRPACMDLIQDAIRSINDHGF